MKKYFTKEYNEKRIKKEMELQEKYIKEKKNNYETIISEGGYILIFYYDNGKMKTDIYDFEIDKCNFIGTFDYEEGKNFIQKNRKF
jgi:hypothetical protein